MPTQQNVSRARVLVVITTAVAFAAMAAGCGQDDEPPTGDIATPLVEYPDWLSDVFPVPDAQVSSIREVQVNHSVTGGEGLVRLEIDGVDVTAYATETRPGLLAYDPDTEASGSAPVELGPGEHSARVMLLDVDPDRFPEGDGDIEESEVVDEFSWSFTVR